MNNRALATYISTCVGLGFMPKAPGTIAAFFGAIFWWILLLKTPLVVYASLLVIICLVGVWATEVYTKPMPLKDPSEVVIDEWVGIGIAMIVCEPRLIDIALAFGLFRLFDIWKPIGVKYFDKMSGPWGVMLDDVVAGVYSALVLFALKWSYAAWF